MDILSFFNRQLDVDESFKTKDISVIVTSYGSHMKSLIQNILFRLENTGHANKLFISENLENKQEIEELVREFSGFFNTELVVFNNKHYPNALIDDTVIILNDYYVLKNKLNYSELNLEELLKPLNIGQDSHILSLSSGYSGTRAIMNLSNIKFNTIKKSIYLDNMYYEDMLENDSFDFELYPVVEGKLFNIFNQIITPDLKVFQTFELIDLITMNSEIKFQFKDISRQDKFLKSKYPFNIDGELLVSEYNLFNMLDIEYSENEQTQGVLKKFLGTFITQYYTELEAEKTILTNRFNTFNELNTSTNNKFSNELELLDGKIKEKNLRLSALKELMSVDFDSITHKDVVELINLSKTLKSGD